MDVSNGPKAELWKDCKTSERKIRIQLWLDILPLEAFAFQRCVTVLRAAQASRPKGCVFTSIAHRFFKGTFTALLTHADTRSQDQEHLVL